MMAMKSIASLALRVLSTLCCIFLFNGMSYAEDPPVLDTPVMVKVVPQDLSENNDGFVKMELYWTASDRPDTADFEIIRYTQKEYDLLEACKDPSDPDSDSDWEFEGKLHEDEDEPYYSLSEVVDLCEAMGWASPWHWAPFGEHDDFATNVTAFAVNTTRVNGTFSFIDTTCREGVHYYYHVMSMSYDAREGYSGYLFSYLSNPMHEWTQPIAPRLYHVHENSNGSVSLKWSFTSNINMYSDYHPYDTDAEYEIFRVIYDSSESFVRADLINTFDVINQGTTVTNYTYYDSYRYTYPPSTHSYDYAIRVMHTQALNDNDPDDHDGQDWTIYEHNHYSPFSDAIRLTKYSPDEPINLDSYVTNPGAASGYSIYTHWTDNSSNDTAWTLERAFDSAANDNYSTLMHWDYFIDYWTDSTISPQADGRPIYYKVSDFNGTTLLGTSNVDEVISPMNSVGVATYSSNRLSFGWDSYCEVLIPPQSDRYDVIFEVEVYSGSTLIDHRYPFFVRELSDPYNYLAEKYYLSPGYYTVKVRAYNRDLKTYSNWYTSYLNVQ